MRSYLSAIRLRLHPQPFLKFLPAILLACLFFSLTVPSHAEERRVEHRVAPSYPELARRMHIGGTIKVQATVSADGAVVKAQALNGNKMLTAAAEDAVRKWKFAAGTAQTTTEVDVTFQAQ